MAIDPALLKILVCPETKIPVSPADDALIAKLNQSIRDGALKNRSGAAVTAILDGGLLRTDGKVLYPIIDDIPVMMIDEAIDVASIR